MVDMLLLSRTNFLLHTNSAMSEMAVWHNSKLDQAEYNLQFALKDQVQRHHLAEFTGLPAIADAYELPKCTQTEMADAKVRREE